MGNDITVKLNRTHTFQATLTSGGSTWDISSNSDINMSVKEDIDQSGTNIALSRTGGEIAHVTDGSDGKINITVDNSKTTGMLGAYIYGIDVTLSGEEYEAMTDAFTVEKTVKG